MVRLNSISLLIVSLVLAGCSLMPEAGVPASNAGPPPGLTPQDRAIADPCNAAGNTGFLGAKLAAVTMPAELNSRILRPGDGTADERDATRLTFELDDTDTIIGLSCG